MEHSLHLSAKHFVQAVTPTSPNKIAKKIKSALQKAHINGDVDLDRLDEEVIGFSFDDGDDGGEDDGGEYDSNTSDFDVGDSLGKALALVGQVSTYVFLL